MRGHRPFSAAHLPAIGRRRWKLAFFSLFLGAGAGYGLARMIPPEFISQGTVAATQSGSLNASIPSAGFTSTQLAALRQQVLTPRLLSEISTRFAPSTPQDPGSSAREAAAHIDQQISLLPAEVGFTVSFRSSNPQTAQQACSALISLLVQEETKILQRELDQRRGDNSSPSANPVVDYLAGQVADAKKGLDEREARLAEFRRLHAAELAGPDRTAAENKIAEDDIQLQAVGAALNRAMQQRTTLTESLFAQQSAAAETQKPAETPATEALEEQLAAKQAQLATLQTRYTPDHPDVVKLRGDIELLQKRIDESKKAAAQPPAKKPNPSPAGQAPAAAQLQVQIHDLDVQIQDKTREQSRLQQELMNLRGRLSTGSILDDEYRELVAEAASARTLYTGLQAKQNDAQKAAAAQAHEQQQLLRVAVPPNLPAQPAYPDPLLFALAGAGSGIAIGIVAMALGELRDKSMRTAGDVEFFLELPTLAVIPPAETAGEHGGTHASRSGLLGNRGERVEGVLTDV